MLQRFSCSPWTLLQLTDITTAAVRTLVLDLDSVRRIILITVTTQATIPIAMDTAIHIMDSASTITGRITVMGMDIAVVTMVDTTGIAAVTMVDTAADIMADIAADTMAGIAVDIMAGIAEVMGVPYKNSVLTNHLAIRNGGQWRDQFASSNPVIALRVE